METNVVKRNTCILIVIIVGVCSLLLGFGLSMVLLREPEDRCGSIEDNCSPNVNEQTSERKKFYDEEPVFGTNYEILTKRINTLSGLDRLNRSVQNVDEYTNQELLLFVMDEVNYFFGKDNTFTLDDVNRVVQYYFGRTVYGEDIKCRVLPNVVVYFYDEETKTFKYNDSADHAHGGGCTDVPIVLNKIIDISTNGSMVTVKVNKAFTGNPDVGYTTDYYRTYSDLKNGSNKLFDALNICNEDICNKIFPEINFNAIDSKKLPVYEYVFDYNVDNDNYVLVSYKIGK